MAVDIIAAVVIVIGVETVDTRHSTAYRNFQSSGLLPARGENHRLGRQQPGHYPAPLQGSGEAARRQGILDHPAGVMELDNLQGTNLLTIDFL